MEQLTHFQCHASDLLREAYYEAVHPCGLRILVAPKEFTANYAVLGVGYGSLHYGKDGVPGLAHFLEHKMFERKDGIDEDSVFASYGAESNAYTGYDRTAYEFSCTDRFDDALTELLRMTDAFSVTAASVRKEKDIISEEIRMALDDPWERINAELLKSLYAAHPIRDEICGTEEDIAHITPALLRKTYHTYYGLDRMVLAVSGQVSPEEVWKVVDAYIASKSGQTRKHRAKSGTLTVHCSAEPTSVHCPFREVYMDGAERHKNGSAVGVSPKPIFSIGIKDTSVPTEPYAVLHRDLCMSVLTEVLFSDSGDFYNGLFEAGLVTSEVSYGSSIGSGYSFGYFTGESDAPQVVMDKFYAYVQVLSQNGLPRDAVERSRRTLYADYVTGFDSTESIGTGLLNHALDGIGVFDFLTAADTVTYEAVTDVFREVFRPEQYALVILHPAETE